MGKRSVGAVVGRVATALVALLVLTAMTPSEPSEPVENSDTSTIRRPGNYGKPNQSRLWYNRHQGRWDALIPRDDRANNPTVDGISASDHYLMLDVTGEQTFTMVELDGRDFGRPDVFWDERTDRLHILSSHPDRVEYWGLGYYSTWDEYALEVGGTGNGVAVPGMTQPDTEIGGDSPATIHVGANGYIWVSVMTDAGLAVQQSTDGGITWLPTPVVVDRSARVGVTTWIDVGDGRIGLFAGENGRVSGGVNVETDVFFWLIAENADPTDPASWTDDTPNIPQPVGDEQSDDHVSAARDDDDNLYFGVKTEGGAPADPLIKLYRRTADGAWSQFTVTRSGDVPEQSRPSLVIDDRGRISIYVNEAEVVGAGSRVAGRFRVPLDELDELADTPLEPLFAHGGTVFTDILTPRHSVDGESGLAVLAHNRTDSEVWVSFESLTPEAPPPLVAPADQDTWLRQRSRWKNYGDADQLEMKTRGLRRERALVRFDLSVVPPGAGIKSARVRLFVTNPDGAPVAVFQMTDAWSEFGTMWLTAGNDYDPTAQGRFVPSDDEEFVTADITALVQSWVCGTPNNGIMLIAGLDGAQSKIASRESADVEHRPRIEVQVDDDVQAPCPGGTEGRN